MSQRRRYKQYLIDPTLKVPRTTRFHHRRRFENLHDNRCSEQLAEELFLGQSESVCEELHSLMDADGDYVSFCLYIT